MGRPGALTALAIITIVLGVLIALNGFWQIVTLAFQEPLQQMNLMFMEQPGVPDETLEMQREMVGASYDVQAEWKLFFWVVNPLTFLFGIVLIIGGALCLRVNPAGRRILAATYGFGIVHGLVYEVGNIMMQLQISQAVQEQVANFAAGEGDEQLEAMMSSVMGVSMALTVAFGGGWLFVKICIYVWGLIYLNLRSMRILFEGPPETELPGS